MLNINNWSWTAIYKCLSCEEVFCVTNKSGASPNFCPFCASGELDGVDEE